MLALMSTFQTRVDEMMHFGMCTCNTHYKYYLSVEQQNKIFCYTTVSCRLLSIYNIGLERENSYSCGEIVNMKNLRRSSRIAQKNRDNLDVDVDSNSATAVDTSTTFLLNGTVVGDSTPPEEEVIFIGDIDERGRNHDNDNYNGDDDAAADDDDYTSESKKNRTGLQTKPEIKVVGSYPPLPPATNSSSISVPRTVTTGIENNTISKIKDKNNDSNGSSRFPPPSLSNTIASWSFRPSRRGHDKNVVEDETNAGEEDDVDPTSRSSLEETDDEEGGGGSCSTTEIIPESPSLTPTHTYGDKGGSLPSSMSTTTTTTKTPLHQKKKQYQRQKQRAKSSSSMGPGLPPPSPPPSCSSIAITSATATRRTPTTMKVQQQRQRQWSICRVTIFVLLFGLLLMAVIGGSIIAYYFAENDNPTMTVTATGRLISVLQTLPKAMEYKTKLEFAETELGTLRQETSALQQKWVLATTKAEEEKLQTQMIATKRHTEYQDLIDTLQTTIDNLQSELDSMRELSSVTVHQIQDMKDANSVAQSKIQEQSIQINDLLIRQQLVQEDAEQKVNAMQDRLHLSDRALQKTERQLTVTKAQVQHDEIVRREMEQKLNKTIEQLQMVENEKLIKEQKLDETLERLQKEVLSRQDFEENLALVLKQQQQQQQQQQQAESIIYNLDTTSVSSNYEIMEKLKASQEKELLDLRIQWEIDFDKRKEVEERHMMEGLTQVKDAKMAELNLELAHHRKNQENQMMEECEGVQSGKIAELNLELAQQKETQEKRMMELRESVWSDKMTELTLELAGQKEIRETQMMEEWERKQSDKMAELTLELARQKEIEETRMMEEWERKRSDQMTELSLELAGQKEMQEKQMLEVLQRVWSDKMAKLTLDVAREREIEEDRVVAQLTQARKEQEALLVQELADRRLDEEARMLADLQQMQTEKEKEIIQALELQRELAGKPTTGLHPVQVRDMVISASSTISEVKIQSTESVFLKGGWTEGEPISPKVVAKVKNTATQIAKNSKTNWSKYQDFGSRSIRDGIDYTKRIKNNFLALPKVIAAVDKVRTTSAQIGNHVIVAGSKRSMAPTSSAEVVLLKGGWENGGQIWPKSFSRTKFVTYKFLTRTQDRVYRIHSSGLSVVRSGVGSTTVLAKRCIAGSIKFTGLARGKANQLAIAGARKLSEQSESIALVVTIAWIQVEVFGRNALRATNHLRATSAMQIAVFSHALQQHSTKTIAFAKSFFLRGIYKSMKAADHARGQAKQLTAAGMRKLVQGTDSIALISTMAWDQASSFGKVTLHATNKLSTIASKEIVVFGKNTLQTTNRLGTIVANQISLFGKETLEATNYLRRTGGKHFSLVGKKTIQATNHLGQTVSTHILAFGKKTMQATSHFGRTATEYISVVGKKTLIATSNLGKTAVKHISRSGQKALISTNYLGKTATKHISIVGKKTMQATSHWGTISTQHISVAGKNTLQIANRYGMVAAKEIVVIGKQTVQTTNEMRMKAANKISSLGKNSLQGTNHLRTKAFKHISVVGKRTMLTTSDLSRTAAKKIANLGKKSLLTTQYLGRTAANQTSIFFHTAQQQSIKAIGFTQRSLYSSLVRTKERNAEFHQVGMEVLQGVQTSLFKSWVAGTKKMFRLHRQSSSFLSTSHLLIHRALQNGIVRSKALRAKVIDTVSIRLEEGVSRRIDATEKAINGAKVVWKVGLTESTHLGSQVEKVFQKWVLRPSGTIPRRSLDNQVITTRASPSAETGEDDSNVETSPGRGNNLPNMETLSESDTNGEVDTDDSEVVSSGTDEYGNDVDASPYLDDDIDARPLVGDDIPQMQTVSESDKDVDDTETSPSLDDSLPEMQALSESDEEDDDE
jgi:hypothetical protein